MYTVKIDKRGKILIPAEMRKSLKLFIGQKVKINMSGDLIKIKPYEYKCILCGAEIPEGSEYGSCEECARKNTRKIY